MKQRDLTIDISKGIGIILVVIGHLTIFSQSFTDVTESIYLFHMPLFFILSGFYCKPSQDFQTYMSNKTKRLFTPFFFYCVFQYLVTLLFAILPWRGVESFLHAIDNFNTWGLWFLVSLWSCYLLHWFVMRVRYHWAVVLMIAALGAALVDIQLRQPFYITQTTLAYPFFYLGYHFKNTKIRGAGMYERLVGYRYKWALLLLSVTVLFCHDYDIQMDMIAIEAPAFPLFYLYAIAGSLLVVLLSNHLMGGYLGRYLACLGQISLHIFGIHSVIMANLYFYLIPVIMRSYKLAGCEIGAMEAKQGWMCAVLSVVIALSASVYLGNLFDKRLKVLFG